jgi:hypothetical protein
VYWFTWYVITHTLLDVINAQLYLSTILNLFLVPLIGSFYYAYVKYQQGQANRPPAGAVPLKNLDKGIDESLPNTV